MVIDNCLKEEIVGGGGKKHNYNKNIIKSFETKNKDLKLNLVVT